MNEEQRAVSPNNEEYAMLGEETIDESSSLGSVCIHNDVIAVIASEAASRVEGVEELPGDILDGIAGMIGRRNPDRGIQVTVEGETVTIDITVILAHGVKIPQVSWELQESVRDAVQEMTGKVVKAVNVIVQGIRIPGREKPSSGEAGE